MCFEKWWRDCRVYATHTLLAQIYAIHLFSESYNRQRLVLRVLSAEVFLSKFPLKTFGRGFDSHCLSNQPLLRPGRQNIRIVISNAVQTRADGAPLVGTGIGFAHQVKEPWHRRGWIEPFVRPVQVDDRLLSMVDVGKRRGGHRGDDGEGLQGFSVLAPALP